MIFIVASTIPLVATPFQIDLLCQVFLACIGSLSLMVLTGFAGQVSLGHAGLIAAGAFTTGILVKEFNVPVFSTIPVAGAIGMILGLVFGLPSLRLRGLYLAVSTLALYFAVIYLGGEYETKRGFSTGILIAPPSVLGYRFTDARGWYFILLAAVILVFWGARNLLASRTGRAWGALHVNEVVAAALGVNVARAKLMAFVVTSAATAVGGALFASYRGFVSVDAFPLMLSVQYVAMIIVGGMGSLVGAVLGAVFLTILPYAIEASVALLPGASGYASQIFAVNYAVFGLVMIAFLVLEPGGLVAIGRRIRVQLETRRVRVRTLEKVS
ncbi:branched-chain amino acid ABC transporter permease [Bradyrhizobium liaoningense]|uniref:branched-chain amino acid ABC transporter permease n=1 Tax=Bradyrhizobium liaoningense TaxID=43992 RepID=UPI001BA737E4|nr:branched-chain amino acid ABC transporter permease [Bradyrhizobium liaoningense]